MSIRAAVITAALFATLASGVLLAQQADPAEKEDGAATASANPGTGAESGQTPGRDEAAPAGDSDPFDYESSEQISEDLSVSFPVDI